MQYFLRYWKEILKISQTELLTEINILENADLVGIRNGEVGEREVSFLAIQKDMLNDLFKWITEESYSIRTLLNTMDFTILDN